MSASGLITELASQVDAAVAEFDQAVAYHETWKPTVYDKGLQDRMGESYATQTFLVIRTALRREMLMALMRLWDTDTRAIRMTTLAARVNENEVVDALVARRDTGAIPDLADHVRSDIKRKADEVRNLVRKWSVGGSHAAIFKELRSLRHEVLAHRQVTPTGTGLAPDEVHVEAFFQDNLALISRLVSILKAVAYDPNDTAGVYKNYAHHFWIGVRGEQTCGHPHYRNPHSGSGSSP